MIAKRWSLVLFVMGAISLALPGAAHSQIIKVIGHANNLANDIFVLHESHFYEIAGGDLSYYINILIYDIGRKKVVKTYPIITNEDALKFYGGEDDSDFEQYPEFRRLRGRRWKKVHKELIRGNFKIVFNFRVLPKAGEKMVRLKWRGSNFGHNTKIGFVALPKSNQEIQRPAEDLVLLSGRRKIVLRSKFHGEVGLGDALEWPRGYIRGGHLSPSRKYVVLTIEHANGIKDQVLVYSIAELHDLLR